MTFAGRQTNCLRVLRFAFSDGAATLTTVMRLPCLPFLRATAALVIAIASPGVAVSHGLAHDYEHEGEHSQSASHEIDAPGTSIEGHSSDHSHPTVSVALRNRADLTVFILLPASRIVAGNAVTSTVLLAPISESKQFGGRATGPPPKLRAPPID